MLLVTWYRLHAPIAKSIRSLRLQKKAAVKSDKKPKTALPITFFGI